MKNLLLICVMVMMFGCSDQGFLGSENDVKLDVMKNHIQTLELEGCEYWVYSCSRGNLGFGFMSHKGNCKNPIHQHNRG